METPDSSAKRVTAVQHARALTFWPVIRVASGNFLEMYDFQVFGYYAAAIAHTFFPSGNEFASLMLSLATFGAGFLTRPIGAIVLGTYIDHRGRRTGLLLTLGLMAIGTVSVACMPSYASIGLIATALLNSSRVARCSVMHEHAP
jgi:MFS family permease